MMRAKPAVVGGFVLGTLALGVVAILAFGGMNLFAKKLRVVVVFSDSIAGLEVFDPDAQDDCLTTLALTQLLARGLDVPIIAAGGIMDGAGIAAALRLGASAAQLGTAFIPCSESGADTSYREALAGDAANHTVMTRAISGRPARCLSNRFTALGAEVSPRQIPPYPIAYDAGKALDAAARAAHEAGYGAQWAGQGAPLARARPAAQLIALLAQEIIQHA
jgi:nitronate monooxygenase